MLHMPSPMLFSVPASYDADAAAYFAAMSVAPTDARKALINDLIVGLKADGVWALLDCLWLIASHDAQAGRLNAKAPGSYALSVVGAPSFVTDRGYLCDGSADALESGFPFATGGGFALNNAHVSAYLNASTASATNNTASLSSSSTTATAGVRPRGSGNVATTHLNGNTVSSGPTVVDATGFRLQSRLAASEVLNQAGATQMTVASASTTVSATATVALMRRGSSYQQGRIAQASIGQGLTATQMTAYYNRLTTFLAAIGAA